MSWHFLNIFSSSIYIMIPAVPFKREPYIFKLLDQISLFHNIPPYIIIHNIYTIVKNIFYLQSPP